MPFTTSTTRMRPSDPRPRHCTVVARNESARPRSARLLAVVAHPLGGRRVAVVATRHPPFLRCLIVIPGGGKPSPDGGPPAPAPALRHAA